MWKTLRNLFLCRTIFCKEFGHCVQTRSKNFLYCGMLLPSKLVETCPNKRQNYFPGFSRLLQLLTFSDEQQRTYVDPFLGLIMPHRFSCETLPCHVTTGEVVGCGEFGEVYRGTLTRSGEACDEDAALFREECFIFQLVNFATLGRCFGNPTLGRHVGCNVDQPSSARTLRRCSNCERTAVSFFAHTT